VYSPYTTVYDVSSYVGAMNGGRAEGGPKGRTVESKDARRPSRAPLCGCISFYGHGVTPGLEQTGNSSEDPGDPECPVYRRRFSEATPDVSQHPELRPWAMPATHSIPNDENEFPRVTPEHGGYDRLLYLPLLPVTFNRCRRRTFLVHNGPQGRPRENGSRAKRLVQSSLVIRSFSLFLDADVTMPRFRHE